MKKLIASAAFCFVMSLAAFAQSPAVVLEKLKQVKFFESTSKDLENLFAGSEEIKFTDENVSRLSTKKLSFNIEYSNGNCDYEVEDWNVPEGKVTHIRIRFNRAIEPEDLGIDLSKLRKEQMFTDSSEDFIYYDKNIGVSYDVCNGKIYYIEFFPPKENLPLLCSNKTERKRFYERKRWQEKRGKTPIIRGYANVNEMILSSNEIISNCDYVDNKNCADDTKLIEVSVEAETSPCSSWDFDYNYTVSAGRIIGQGEKVVWDLSGVKPGKYTITAGVDNGCGVCGTTKTETVTVKNCTDCGQK